MEEWLVDTAPFGLDQQDIDDFRSAAGDTVVEAFRSSGGTVVSGTVAAFQGLAGLALGLITTFFFLKDGPRFASWALARVPSGRRELARASPLGRGRRSAATSAARPSSAWWRRLSSASPSPWSAPHSWFPSPC